VDKVAILRHHVFEEYFVCPLGKHALVTENAVVLGRATGCVIQKVQLPCSRPADFESELQPLLALTLGPLGPLAVGDVLCENYDPPDFAVVPAPWLRLPAHPLHLAVGALEAI